MCSHFDLCLIQSWTDLDGVKEHGVLNHIAIFAETLGQEKGGIVNLPGDGLQSLWTMIDSIHGADVGQESLGRTDVAGGLVSPDVLFPSL